MAICYDSVVALIGALNNYRLEIEENKQNTQFIFGTKTPFHRFFFASAVAVK